MTEEQLATIEQLAADTIRKIAQERDAARAELNRLRSGAELMRSRAPLFLSDDDEADTGWIETVKEVQALRSVEKKPAPTESERLRSLLMRAHNAICDGFLGGEWAIYVHQQDGITMAAAKEADEAEETLDAIRQELALPKNSVDGKRWQHIAARHAAAREG